MTKAVDEAPTALEYSPQASPKDLAEGHILVTSFKYWPFDKSDFQREKNPKRKAALQVTESRD